MEKKKAKKGPKENLRQARTWVLILNIIAAVLFIVVYINLKDYLFLIASLLLFFSGIAFFFLLKYLERKYDKI
jgi:energy-coupling factor transporter transmembrane protein EcfT